MANLKKLFVALGLDSSGFDAGLDKANKKVKTTQEKLKATGGFMTVAFTLPAIAAVAGFVHLGDEHDALTDKLRINTGKTGADLKQLDSDALAVFGNIPTTMAKVGDAFSFLSAKTNDTGADLMNVAQNELELARITGSDLNTTMQTSTDLFNNWGVAAKDQVTTLDKLLRASQNTGVGVDQLAGETAQYGSTLREMGFDLDSSIALIGTLDKAGVDTGATIQGMKVAFKHFADEGLTDTNAALQDVFTQIKNAPDDLAAGAIAIDTFGAKAGPQLSDAIRGGKLDYLDLLKTIRTGTDTINSTAVATNDWKENLEILRNRISVKLIPVADYFFAKLNKGVTYVEKIELKFEDLYDRIGKLSPALKKFGLIFLGVLVALGPVLLGIAGAMSIWATISGAAAALFSPVILIIVGLIAIGFLLYKAWTTDFGGIQEKTHTAVAFIGKWLGKLWDFVQPAIKAVKLLGTYFHDVMTNKIQPKNLAKLPGWLRPIALVFGRIIKTVRVFIKLWQDKGPLAAIRNLQYQIKAFGRAASKLLDQMGLHHLADAVKKTFYDLAKTFNDIVTLVDDVIHGRWKQIWGDLKNIAVDMVKLFIDRFVMIGALIVDVFNLIPWGKVGDALWSGLQTAWAFVKDTGAPFVATKGLELLTALYDAMTAVWKDTVKPWLESLPGKLAGFIGAHWQEVYDAGRNLLSWLWTGISSLASWLYGQIPNITAGIFNALESFGGWFYNAGRDIVSGLWTGIASLGGWLWQQVWTFVKDNTIGALNKAIGRNSPPKAFIDAGSDIPKAVAIGIDKTAHLARLASSTIFGDLMGGNAGAMTVAPGRPAAGAALASGAIGGGHRINQFAAGAIVVKADGVSRAEANRLAKYILDEADSVSAGAHS